MQSAIDNIFNRIKHKGRGATYTTKDFLDLGVRDVIDQSLSRLNKRGKIRRIIPGIYDFPRINDKLGGQLSPDIDKVAKAIARKNSMRIMISGARAVNKIGLSTQVPAQTVYLTDGQSRKISIGNFRLVFRHVSPKRMSFSQTKSTVILQALKYIGKDNMDNDIIKSIKDMLTDGNKQQLAKDVQNSSAWLINVVSKIVGNQDG